MLEERLNIFDRGSREKDFRIDMMLKIELEFSDNSDNSDN